MIPDPHAALKLHQREGREVYDRPAIGSSASRRSAHRFDIPRQPIMRQLNGRIRTTRTSDAGRKSRKQERRHGFLTESAFQQRRTSCAPEHRRSAMLCNSNMVPKAGLEPAQLTPLPPQDSVSTNSTTWAKLKVSLAPPSAPLLCSPHLRCLRLHLLSPESPRWRHHCLQCPQPEFRYPLVQPQVSGALA